MVENRSARNGLRFATGLSLALFAGTAFGSQQEAGQEPAPGESAQQPVEGDAATRLSKKEQIEFSRQDLAARLEIDLESVKLSGAPSVMWRSGALGCPEPGKEYTLALVPGVWITLRVENEVYRYHAIPGSQPFYCPSERAEPPYAGAGAD